MARLTTLLFAMWLGVTVSTVVDLEKRIIGGDECGANERWYHVKLISTDGVNSSLCGGSLISNQWILTAAHCFKPGGWSIAITGVHPGPLRNVQITGQHEIFNDRTGQGHNLMLLKLPKAVVGIQPVRLPDCTDPPNIGAAVQVAGHGTTQVGPNNEKLDDTSDTLQCADMNVTDYQVVQHEHRIFYRAPGVDTCPGDSGGGVVYNHMIYGVHVRSGDTYACIIAAAFMDLCHPPYLTWINRIINQP